uniref:Dipeptidyl peptidase 3 n=1 Tax=Parascaris univalens TaxID=6257 RepID=A0A915AIE3_PARUN
VVVLHPSMLRALRRVVSLNVSRFGESGSTSLVPIVFKRRSTHYCYSSAAIGKPKEKSIMAAINKSMYMYPNDTPICALDCVDAFNTLTDKEKRYAYFMAKASFDGSLIVFCQVSPESPALFVILYRLFSSESVESLRKKSIDLNWSESEFTALLVYTAGFYADSGNYKGFGDTKIVPAVSPDKFSALLEKSEAAKKYTNFMKLYRSIEEHVFSLKTKDLSLGFPDKAVTGYHSKLVTKADTDLIDRYFKSKHMEGWNTRLVKKIDGNKTSYIVRLASLAKSEQSREEFEGTTIIIERGDYAPILSHTIKSLKEALGYVANENQKNMISKYINHFETGNIVDHMDGSRFWIKDKGPNVECYIGFIENYRDPAGTRAEFEGFVAAVNKEMTKKFHELVRKAEELLVRLPWDKEYEKDKFLRPDFTSLDVIAFGGSGIPAGINIPNYDAIRQNEGFKNVSLGNVIAAMPKQKINFLVKEDEELLLKYRKEAFEMQVGLHELLGHGSGKLLQRNKDGTFNFDKNLKDMLTGKPVSSWYEPGETWSSKFGALSSAYEECRAEAVGYFLCTYPDVLKIFGHEGEMAETIKYVNWMSEVLAGLLVLEFYSPDTKNWGQAHCFARYTLLQVCLEAGDDFVTITEKSGEDGKPDLLFKLDPKKIDSVGKPAVGAFLRKLQAYKSTGDSVGGSKFFNEVGAVKAKNLKWREIVIARRQPRRMFLQSNTVLNEKGDVVLKTYPETFEGIIQSVVDRYSPQIVADLEALWCGDPHFSLTH